MAKPPKLKLEKPQDDFDACNVDNTAPVKNIFNDFLAGNGKVHRYLTQMVNQRSSMINNTTTSLHYLVPAHPLQVFPDNWDGELPYGYFEDFTYKSLMPKMISPMLNVGKSDPVAEVLCKKHNWQCKGITLKRNALKLPSHMKVNEEVMTCPKQYVKLAGHLDSDPDPYFDSPYNWYYAGNGNLQFVTLNYTEYLLYSVLNCLYLAEFNQQEMKVKFDSALSFDCGEGIHIHETIFSQDFIALRTMNKIFVLKVTMENDNNKIEQLKVAESITAYTSISFDSYHKNILYVTTLDNNLTIVNLDRLTGRKVKLRSTVESLVDNWCSVLGSERPYYTHISRNSITTYDKRTNSAAHTWKGPNDVSDEMLCNNISIAKHSPGSNYLYFGTTHHLFLADLRYSNKLKPKIVQRWNHGMQCLPTYISMCHFESNKELLCLSSQWCEDMCVVSNYVQSLKHSDITGVSIPYRPPSILKVLYDARQKQLCHNLYDPIDERLTLALTGTLLIEQGEKYQILMQNSLGDISCHTLFPEHMEMFMEDDSPEALHAWSQNYQKSKRAYEVTYVKNISEIWKKLKKVPDGKVPIKKLDPSLGSMKELFNEKEIFDAFENGEIEEGLLDIWIDQQDETSR